MVAGADTAAKARDLARRLRHAKDPYRKSGGINSSDVETLKYVLRFLLSLGCEPDGVTPQESRRFARRITEGRSAKFSSMTASEVSRFLKRVA
jgi:hypothetical protein